MMMSEIEEEEEHSSELFEIKNEGLGLDPIREENDDIGLYSFDFHNNNGGENAVYVAIGKSTDESSSMDALLWTLNHAAASASAVVFLVHVFPETKFIPMPLGMIPASQVNPEHRENYMAQERSKRRDFLNNFLNVCTSTSSKVKVDTILIESDMEAKAILDLIPILNIKKLVVGTSKSNLRRMRANKRASATAAEQILKDAPEFCEVKIICEGREIVMAEESPESPSPQQNHVQLNNDPSFTCCFKPRVR